MRTAICCIAKCENNYLKEWVDYHLDLGFSHIYIYDNNNVNGECILPTVANYEQVTIIDCRGKRAYQTIAYADFYKSFGSQYDWITFIDVDEFITFSKESGICKIDEFLGRFNETVDIIHLNWMCYGDNDIVDINDNFSVLDRFVRPLDYNQNIQYDFPENNHVKSIIRGNLDLRNGTMHQHSPIGDSFHVVGADGIPCKNGSFKPYEFSIAYIRHYVTKTIYEWILKVSRGRVSMNIATELYPIDKFFLYNKRTAEKEKVVRDFLLFKDAIAFSADTELSCYREELKKVNAQLTKTNKSYTAVLSSNSYKLGKSLIAPFKWLKTKIR